LCIEPWIGSCTGELDALFPMPSKAD